jgi:hypothetical protein
MLRQVYDHGYSSKPSGEIPNHQLSFKPATASFHHQKSKFEFQHIESINSKPIIIPAIAPSLFIFLSKIPRMIAGNNEAAANPKQVRRPRQRSQEVDSK